MNILHTLGLMKRSEHEAAALQAAADKQLLEKLTAERDQAITAMAHAEFSRDCWRDLASGHEAKFKRAATDLAAQAEEIAGYKHRAGLADDLLNAQSSEILALRPDALAMRRKRQMDRDRRKGR